MVPLLFSSSAAMVVFLLFPTLWSVLLPVLVVLAVCYLIVTHRLALVCCVLVGLSLGLMRADHCQRVYFKGVQQPQTVTVVGKIMTIPRYRYHATQFDFLIQAINHQHSHLRVRVRWYGRHPYLQIEDDWRLRLKIKGFARQQSWMYAKGLQAYGYVVKNSEARLVRRVHWQHSINVARQRLAEKIHHVVTDRSLGAILIALTTGSRQALQAHDWQVFQNTGTSHLIAISGLHLGLVAVLVYRSVERLWCLFPTLVLWMPAKKIAAIFSLLVSMLYAAFAGWSLPTQRALLMLAVMLLAHYWNRQVPLWYRLLVAFSVSLFIWPMAVFSVGFWLSYAAVSLIGFGFSARLRIKRGFGAWCYLQTLMFVGLMPVTLLFFQRVSVVGWLANLIAVPYMSFLLVPAGLLASLLFFCCPGLSFFVWSLLAQLVRPLWGYLTALSHWSIAVWQHDVSQAWVFASLTTALCLFFVPRYPLMKMLAVIFLLPLFNGLF